MIEIKGWLEIFLQRLQETFPCRIEFVGLQGSYARGEATETSDIDLVVIFDVLEPEDLARYRAMLDVLPHRELICGFVAGKAELVQWAPYDLFQLYFDTHPIQGSLESLLPQLDAQAVRQAVQNGACVIYHACVHNLLHAQDAHMLRDLFKSAAFVVQAVHYQRTGHFIQRQTDLLVCVEEPEREILQTSLHLRQCGEVDLIPMSNLLFQWSQGLISAP